MEITIITSALGVWFMLYVTYLYVNFGWLHSISASYYVLQKQKKGRLFSLFCLGLGVGIIALVSFMPDNTQGLFFFSGAGALFVGAAVEYKKKLTTKRVRSVDSDLTSFLGE